MIDTDIGSTKHPSISSHRLIGDSKNVEFVHASKAVNNFDKVLVATKMFIIHIVSWHYCPFCFSVTPALADLVHVPQFSLRIYDCVLV